jgi:hypothetical protein
VGDNITGKVLACQEGLEVYTFDFDEHLSPDFVGDVTQVDRVLGDRHFDVILCCQVLEHLPYSYFEDILQQLKRHTHQVILSLPYAAMKSELEWKISRIGSLRIRLCIPLFYKRHQFEGEHYWEIGTRGYSLRRVLSSMRKFFTIRKHYLAPRNSYHRFFLLTE